jgi:hypothetical protein
MPFRLLHGACRCLRQRPLFRRAAEVMLKECCRLSSQNNAHGERGGPVSIGRELLCGLPLGGILILGAWWRWGTLLGPFFIHR